MISILKAARLIERDLERDLGKIGLTYGRYRLLSSIVIGKPLTVLAKDAEFNPTTMVNIVDCLVRDGLVVRERLNQDDRRQISLCMTAKGVGKLIEAHPIVDQILEVPLPGFVKDFLYQLVEAMKGDA